MSIIQSESPKPSCDGIFLETFRVQGIMLSVNDFYGYYLAISIPTVPIMLQF